MTIDQGVAAKLPWVLLLAEARKCDGYRYSIMPARALTDPFLREQYRCKNRARWRFSALKQGVKIAAMDGVYCWAHLVADCLYFSPAEEARTEEAATEITRAGPVSRLRRVRRAS